MTALNFPDSPSNGDTYQGYTYNSTKGTWAKPAEQDARTAVYANIAALPTSGTAGDMAFVTATNRLYLWTGTGWYNIALINNTPTISGVSATYDLAIDGTATTVTITATDPEGIPITYSIASDTSGNIATVAQGTGANTNVFTITPSTNDDHAGTFSLTFRASDGVNIASAAASFTLEFIVQNSRYTTSLITSVGANNATNASFDDKSTNNHTITTVGDAHQTTFSPYRPGGYAEHFTNDRVSYANHSSMQIGTQDFCMEAWIKLRTQGVNYERFITHQASWAQGGVKGVEFAASTVANQYLEIMIDGSSATDFGYSHSIEKERWYHAVITRESGHARIFIDGVLENNAANTTNINGSGGTHFGTNTAGTDQMDDFFIRDFRLCIGGVPTDYSTTSTTNDATIFTPPQAHITKTSQGATASEVKALLFNTPHVQQDNSDNTNASLTFHSKGVTVAAEGAPYDTVRYTAATHGGSAFFAASDDYLQLPADSSLAMGTGEFTWEFWVYIQDNTSDAQNIIDLRNGSTGLKISFNTSPAQTLGVYSEVAASQVITSSAINIKTWHHVALTRDSSNNLRLFVNGIQSGSTATSHTSNYTHNSGRIGIKATNLTQELNGSLSDVRIVKGTAVYTANFTPPTSPLSAITNTSLLLPFTDAGIIDKSQSQTTARLYGNAKSSTAQNKYLTSSISIAADGDYIQFPSQSGFGFGTGDFTIEAWVYWTGGAFTGGNAAGIVSLRDSATAQSTILFVNRTNGNLRVYDGPANTSYEGTALPQNDWVHVAVSRQGTTWRMFNDGTQSNTWTSSSDLGSSRQMIIGRLVNGTAYNFVGYISDVRITKGLARYTSNFTAPTAELKG